MINYRPCNKTVAMASDQLHRVEGRGNLVIDFQSGTGTKRMELIDVGYVPSLSYNLGSLAKIVKAGHKYTGDDPGLTVHLQSEEDLLCPIVGDMYISYGRRVDGDDIEHARAVIAPGLLPTTDVDVNEHHRTTAHTHPRLLRESARQQGVKLKPGVKLLPCVECSTAKGFSAPVKKTTECRSDKKHGTVFVDLSGKKPVLSMGGKQ